MVFWKEFASRYSEAQVVFPWSDVANFVIVDRRLAHEAPLWAEKAVRTGNWSGAGEVSLSGETILIYTGSDGGWKVLVRVHGTPPIDVPEGDHIVCPLEAPTGELVIHCGSYVYALPEVVDPDDEFFDPDDHAARNDDLDGEPVIATVPPGSYAVRVTRPEVDGDDDPSLPEDERAPDYLVDLWPQSSDPTVRYHWHRLG